ncbi:endonuclease/exonuclease/phosphatase family protein [Streptomyces triculaminicus]|uniref:Endonuclease/exonuclease/phosphatase family protein n=1 Tax=Streptomyces triculaminicus TaxID=2816232 RepID=A0A939FN19_9ACTN|nr:endonuclease/exonuclease/phosphatase family protein [Streptomyces triculaminicus]MBO0654623.1 endonuclease/exonuclease/phosphatase family protein [Streptomyces triculaminicus]
MNRTAHAVPEPPDRPRLLSARRDEDLINEPVISDATGWLVTDGRTTTDARRQVAGNARLVTYNTLTGGIDSDGGEWRRRRQIEFLASLDADIIALQELRRWDEGGWWRLWGAANALGMVPLPPVLSARGRGNHLALLYRPATVRIDDYEPDAASGTFHHGLGRARLSIKGQPLLTVLFTHLCVLGGAERYAEAQWLAGYGGAYEGEPQRVVLAGDLNSIGANDPEPDWSRMPANLRARHCHLTAGGTFGDTDRRALQLLSLAGFRDPFEVLGQATPRTVGYWSPQEAVDHRRDFILANTHVADHIAAAAVHDSKATRALSDHLPVVLDLQAP